MIQIKEYIDGNGQNHFGKWFEEINASAAAKITTHLTRLGNGNYSQTKGVGKGVFERKIDFGPGYRIYFGKDGEKLLILLCGGEKKGQQKDIIKAQKLWQEYKKRKKEF